jgi:prevent-host-death family protein
MHFKEVLILADVKMKPKIPMEHLNITEFNRGQSSKVIKKLVEEDKAAYINKNGKPIAVIMSNERYERLIAKGIDINEY